MFSLSAMRWTIAGASTALCLFALTIGVTYWRAVTTVTAQEIRDLGSEARMLSAVTAQTSPERVADILRREQSVDPRLRFVFRLKDGRVLLGGLETVGPGQVGQERIGQERIGQGRTGQDRSLRNPSARLPTSRVVALPAGITAASRAENRSWALVQMPIDGVGLLEIARRLDALERL
ncbi:MAG: hypothetical protein AAFY53_03135, partial [Pseudomonadota bacterium]